MRLGVLQVLAVARCSSSFRGNSWNALQFLLLGQGDAAIRVLMNVAALLQFSCEFNQRAASRVAQAQRRGNFAKALRPAGSREVRHDLSFSYGRSSFIVHCG